MSTFSPILTIYSEFPSVVYRPCGTRKAQPGHAVVLAGRRACDGTASLEDAGDDWGVDFGDWVRLRRGEGRGLFVSEVVRVGAACEGKAGYGYIIFDGNHFAGEEAVLRVGGCWWFYDGLRHKLLVNTFLYEANPVFFYLISPNNIERR